MTEEEWLSATDPTPMLESLRGKASDRKLRLFAVACCYRIWSLLYDVRSRKAVLDTEQYADGLLTDEQLVRVYAEAEAAFLQTPDPRPLAALVSAQTLAASAAWGASVSRSEGSMLCPDVPLIEMAINTAVQAADTAEYDRQGEERAYQCWLVRDIFANPFHPIPLNPSWQTSTVLALAQGIYEDRAFDRLPILADAHQDVSCDNPDLLNHLRSEGPHTRACWALDLLLNRE